MTYSQAKQIAEQYLSWLVGGGAPHQVAKLEEMIEGALEGWQPIYTAPKDGTKIDIWGRNLLAFDKRLERIVDVKWGRIRDWMGHERHDWQHGRGEDFEPTHWMPLPLPPNPKD